MIAVVTQVLENVEFTVASTEEELPRKNSFPGGAIVSVFRDQVELYLPTAFLSDGAGRFAADIAADAIRRAQLSMSGGADALLNGKVRITVG
ncbi:hypothetical protein AB0K48_45035 [Nonomuraea sp. NPDC055795]